MYRLPIALLSLLVAGSQVATEGEDLPAEEYQQRVEEFADSDGAGWWAVGGWGWLLPRLSFRFHWAQGAGEEENGFVRQAHWMVTVDLTWQLGRPQGGEEMVGRPAVTGLLLASMVMGSLPAVAEVGSHPAVSVVGEPTVQEVIETTLRRSRVNAAALESMQERAARRGWLPRLTARVERGTGIGWSDRNSGDDLADWRTTSTDDDLGFLLELRWELADLAYTREELWVAREAIRLAESRRKLVERVAALYFDRQRLLVELRSERCGSLRQCARTRIDLEALTANLDAFTGGAFQDRWQAAAPTGVAVGEDRR